MLKAALVGAIAVAALLLAEPTAAAETVGSAAPPTISVSSSAGVDYAPDIARLSLGARAEATSAAAAALSVNGAAQSILAAVRRLGIPAADIKTSGYSLYYREPQPRVVPLSESSNPASPAPAPSPSPSGGAGRGFPGERRVVVPGMPEFFFGGSYVAAETITVKVPIDKAGAVIDAAIGAGANQTYGISFDTSQRDKLYREALAMAVQEARRDAEILANAAHASIVGIQSIVIGEFARPLPFAADGYVMRSTAPGAPILGGTDRVTAAVTVVYRIR